MPLGATESELFYRYFNRLEARDSLVRDNQLGPYWSPQTDNPENWILTEFMLREHALAARLARPVALEAATLRLNAVPFKNVIVGFSASLDESRAVDQHYTGKKWRGMAGDVENAYVHYQTNRFTLTAGRFSEFWGSHSSLIFSKSQFLDGLSYRLLWGPFTLSYRFASLSPYFADSSNLLENRYLAGHRLDMHLSPHLRLGLSELVVFGGNGRQVELYYLNPLLPFHFAQLNANINDNTLIGADFSWRPLEDIKLTGQILIDDYQIDNDSPGDREPSQIASRVNAYVADVVEQFDMEIDYSRVSNWTFNQILARNRYTHGGKPLGDTKGNDYDDLAISMHRWIRPDARLSAEASYTRQGEGSVNAAWSEPWIANPEYSEPFPTGVVERTLTFALSYTATTFTHGFVNLKVGLSSVVNRHNLPRPSVTLPFAECYVSCSLSLLSSFR